MNVIYRSLALSVTGPECFQPGLLNLRNSFISPFTCRLTPALLGWPVVNGAGCLLVSGAASALPDRATGDPGENSITAGVYYTQRRVFLHVCC